MLGKLGKLRQKHPCHASSPEGDQPALPETWVRITIRPVTVWAAPSWVTLVQTVPRKVLILGGGWGQGWQRGWEKQELTCSGHQPPDGRDLFSPRNNPDLVWPEVDIIWRGSLRKENNKTKIKCRVSKGSRAWGSSLSRDIPSKPTYFSPVLFFCADELRVQKFRVIRYLLNTEWNETQD